MGSSFIHLIRTDSNEFFLMAEQCSIVYMYHSFLIHSSADGHLGCFHVLAIKDSAVINIGVHVSLSKGAFESKHQDTATSGRGLGHQLGGRIRCLGTPAHPSQGMFPDMHSVLPGYGGDLEGSSRKGGQGHVLLILRSTGPWMALT